MINRLSYLFLVAILFVLRGFRSCLERQTSMYRSMGIAWLQPVFEWIARHKAYHVYRRALRDCPAYQEFIGIRPVVRNASHFDEVPVTDKDNYVRAFSIESRCYGGKIPRRGVIIDESSGSSGTPNNWVRGPAERASVARLIQMVFDAKYGDEALMILNCFALGPWATGMSVSMSLAEVARLKSIGPDVEKLENSLRTFGPDYHYMIAGYPPFIRNFVDTTSLDLNEYNAHLVVGGEGISENLRTHLAKHFRSITSSYGASDLEINIASESDLTIAIRKICHERPELSRKLFGRDDAPMIFQYNPLDYVIEQNDEGELLFTIARLSNVAPKLRYNLHDLGGRYRAVELFRILRSEGVKVEDLKVPVDYFPILYLFGRSDLTVPFYGSKIFTSDIESIIYGHEGLAGTVNTFQIRSFEDETLTRQLLIRLECAEGHSPDELPDGLVNLMFEGLIRVNQDFREVSSLFEEAQLTVEVFEYMEGPFASRDIRVKNRYISE